MSCSIYWIFVLFRRSPRNPNSWVHSKVYLSKRRRGPVRRPISANPLMVSIVTGARPRSVTRTSQGMTNSSDTSLTGPAQHVLQRQGEHGAFWCSGTRKVSFVWFFLQNGCQKWNQRVRKRGMVYKISALLRANFETFIAGSERGFVFRKLSTVSVHWWSVNGLSPVFVSSQAGLVRIRVSSTRGSTEKRTDVS